MPRRRKRRLRRPDSSTKTGPSETSAVAGASLPGTSSALLALSSWMVISCRSWPSDGSPEFSQEAGSGRPGSGAAPGSSSVDGPSSKTGPSLKRGRTGTVRARDDVAAVTVPAEAGHAAGFRPDAEAGSGRRPESTSVSVARPTSSSVSGSGVRSGRPPTARSARPPRSGLMPTPISGHETVLPAFGREIGFPASFPGDGSTPRPSRRPLSGSAGWASFRQFSTRTCFPHGTVHGCATTPGK